VADGYLDILIVTDKSERERNGDCCMAWCDSSAAKRWQGADKDEVLVAWRRSDNGCTAGARRVAEIPASQGNEERQNSRSSWLLWQ